MITEIDKNTALVLIDFQNMHTARKLVHPFESVLAKAIKLADAFRAVGKPVVLVNVNNTGAAWTKTRKEPQAPMPIQAANPFELVPELNADKKDIFITKATWNAFFETSLHEELQKRTITGIVLCGVSTRIGVEGTARAASELGYNVSFATDAMTDTDQTSHDNCLNILFPRIGELGTVEDIISKLD